MATTEEKLTEFQRISAKEFLARQLYLTGTVAPDATVIAPLGAFYKDTVTKIRYENNGTVAAPVWEELISGGTGGGGSVFILDITPQSSGNCTGKTLADGAVLTNVTSNTNLVTVHFLAHRAASSYIPRITINGNIVDHMTLTFNSDGLYEGSFDIDMTGDTTGEIVASNAGGAISTCAWTFAAAPVVTSATFTGSMPGTQTELKEDDTIDVTIVADQDVDRVEIVANGDVKGSVHDVTAGDTHVITVTIDDVGAGAVAGDFDVKVRTASGSWSDEVTSSNTVQMNNTFPVINIGVLNYPTSQTALKDAEEVTVNHTIADYDTVTYSSQNGDLGVVGDANTFAADKKYARVSGNYSVSTQNVRIVAVRAANDASTTANKVVKIAHVAAVLDIVTASRLRSPDDHDVTLNFNQQMTSTDALSADLGSLNGAFDTLTITDATAKGAGTFSAVSAFNLANIETTTIGSGASYTVGGFLNRNIAVPAFQQTVSIGTDVVDTAKLVASTGAGVPLVYTSNGTAANGSKEYTIVNDSDFKILDEEIYNGNATGELTINVEETI